MADRATALSAGQATRRRMRRLHLRPVQLYLVRHNARPACAACVVCSRRRPRRRLLVLRHQLHGGRKPNRRRDAPGGVVRSGLGERWAERAGGRCGPGQWVGTGQPHGIIVHGRSVPGVQRHRTCTVPDHHCGWGKRRAQRSLLRRGPPSDSDSDPLPDAPGARHPPQ